MCISVCVVVLVSLFFFFQAEDGIRDLVRSRGLGDVYKRQVNAESDKLVQQASWILVGWMLSHGEEYLEKVAIIQPTKKLIESPIYKSMPYSDVFAKDFENAKIVYVGKASARLSTLLSETIQNVMVGGVDPKVALEKLRKSAQEALDSAD